MSPLRPSHADDPPRPRATHRHMRATSAVALTIAAVSLATVVIVRASNTSSTPQPVSPPRAAAALSTATAFPSGSAASSPSPTPTPATRTQSPVPPSGRTVALRVPVLSQKPALPNGCEVTSLAMLLTAAGLPTDKMVLAREQRTDPAQPVFRTGAKGDLSQITSWGDPNTSFVGNVYGRYGYGIYHKPLFNLLRSKAGARARDLSGNDFTSLLDLIDRGQPVLMWATTTLRPTNAWVTWQGPHGPVRATFFEHAVVLIGHAPGKLIINNPLTGRRQVVPQQPLIEAWRQLGQQALTIDPKR